MAIKNNTLQEMNEKIASYGEILCFLIKNSTTKLSVIIWIVSCRICQLFAFNTHVSYNSILLSPFETLSLLLTLPY